jgi:hypothetical protein
MKLFTTHRPGAGIGHQSLQSVNLIGRGAIGIDVDAEIILEGALGVGDLGLKQVNDAMPAVVVAQFQAGSDHMNGDLFPGVLGRADDIGSTYIKYVVTGISLILLLLKCYK